MTPFISLFISQLVISVVCFFPLRDILRAPATAKKNFQGYFLAGSSGLLVPIAISVTMAIEILRGGGAGGLPVSWLIFYFYLTFVCLLGFIDDILGDRKSTGIRGHFRELTRGHFTSGALKAIGGVMIAIIVAGSLEKRYVLEFLLDVGVLTLSLNAFNSLDLRPGRAIKVFLIVAVALIVAVWSPAAWFVWVLAIPPVLVLLWADLRLQSMLGDAGSNLLGAIIGFVTVSTLNWKANLVILALLVLFHLYTETRSISELVMRVRWLRRLDELGLKRR